MEMFLFWGLTLGTAGKVLLGLTVISVHWKIVKEHKIDQIVLREMRHERNLALLGIILILAGYIIEISFYGYLPLPSLFI
jgi:hypothetical protein